jgi:hypothetical protein
MLLQRARRWSATLGLLVAFAAGAAHAANPAGLYFTNFPTQAQYTNIGDFKAPTALLIAGRCNRDNAHFAQARTLGGEVLAYINPVDILDSPGTCQAGFFVGSRLWPYPTEGARSNWTGSHLADLQAGSSWADSVVSYVEQLMRAGTVDGVMLDVVGGRLWAADWNNWPQWEKDAWTAGNVDLARRLNDSRKRINPFFIIVNNNFWNPVNVEPDPAVVYPGEQYVDGIVIENHTATEMNPRAYAGRPYGNPGAGLEHRRVIVIAGTRSDGQAWTAVPGVTHVAHHIDSDYSVAQLKVVEPSALTDRPHWFGRVDHGTTTSTGMTANFKRVSKFTLSQAGTLDRLWAYLDGGDGTSGMQELRMVLYRDGGGTPSTKVTESNSKWLGAAAPGGWREFVVPHLALSAGDYWIGIFSGTTAGLARNYSDASVANWYGNADTFADGAISPFGAGNTGTVELSVFATYTVP